MVVDWGKKGLEGKTAALINLMRRRGLDLPIILLIRRKRFEDMPVEVLDFIDGYVFLVRGDAGLHRQEPDQPAQAICRDAEDAVLRRAGRLCRGRQPALDLPGPQWRRVLQPQPDRPRLRRASRRGGVPRRPRQFGARPRRPPDPRGPGAAGAEGSRADLRRGEDLFRAQRHLDLQQGRARRPRRRRRPRAVRPQQPQGRPSRRADDRRRHPGLSCRPTATPGA